MFVRPLKSHGNGSEGAATGSLGQGRTAPAPPRGTETPASSHEATSATAHPSVTCAVAEIMVPSRFQLPNYTQVHFRGRIQFTSEFSITRSGKTAMFNLLVPRT